MAIFSKSKPQVDVLVLYSYNHLDRAQVAWNIILFNTYIIFFPSTFPLINTSELIRSMNEIISQTRLYIKLKKNKIK